MVVAFFIPLHLLTDMPSFVFSSKLNSGSGAGRTSRPGRTSDSPWFLSGFETLVDWQTGRQHPFNRDKAEDVFIQSSYTSIYSIYKGVLRDPLNIYSCGQESQLAYPLFICSDYIVSVEFQKLNSVLFFHDN